MNFTNSNSSVAIYRKTNTGNNVSPDYNYTLIDTVDCIKNQLSENRVIRSEGDKILADHVIFIDYISDIRFTDFMVVGSEYFQIYKVYNPNNMNHHLEIFGLKMEHGFDVGES